MTGLPEDVRLKIKDERKKHFTRSDGGEWDGGNEFEDGAEFGYQLGYEEAMKEHGKVIRTIGILAFIVVGFVYLGYLYIRKLITGL